MVPFFMTLSDPQRRFQGHGVTVDAIDVLCAELTRDLFAITKFVFVFLMQFVFGERQPSYRIRYICLVRIFATDKQTNKQMDSANAYSRSRWNQKDEDNVVR